MVLLVFCDFIAICRISAVKSFFFQFDEKSGLKAVAETLKNIPPRRESAPGAREKIVTGARLGSRATEPFCLATRGKRGRREPVQGGRSDSCLEAGDIRVAAPLDAAWDSIRSGLRRDLGARTFDGWLKPAQLGSLDPDTGTLELLMPSQFMADWVRSHFGERLTL